MKNIYKNRLVVNQRGGAIVIDSSTNSEKTHISDRHGNNLNLNKVVNSELATNNKQTNVVNDEYKTVGNNSNAFVAGDNILRIGGNSYNFQGFISQSELDAYSDWKEIYRPIALLNSNFKIERGGESYPNGESLKMSGNRSANPVLAEIVVSVNNKFSGYINGVPIVGIDQDEVTDYSHVPDRGKTTPAARNKLDPILDIQLATGNTGSGAPGTLEFGPNINPSTEDGTWKKSTTNISDALLAIQDKLSSSEANMGNGGDKIEHHKRNKFETVGATFNDYPSVRIDDHGRSQPMEMVVGKNGAFKNHDYAPMIEEVDNSSTFPCGEDSKIICNRYNRTVGSGGINLKTTGCFEIGGTTLKVGAKHITINSSHGLHIASESFVELQSLKSIVLRTNRQVYVECALGVKNNVVIGGGSYTEGETYLQHVTAPLEVQQTEETLVMGKFNTDTNRRLLIGETNVNGTYYPTYAIADENIMMTYPHSHHFNNLPLRLATSNADVRLLAANEEINTHGSVSQALGQQHERKVGVSVK